MKALIRQFGHPRGPLGFCVGHLMAAKNGERSRFALEILAARPGERLLEVGFGPGVDVARLLAAVGPSGFVAGVDVSSEMQRQATRRNRRAIATGRAELRLGAATELPFLDASFDGVYSVNAAQFWADLVQGMREVARVLVRGGRGVVVVQPMARGASRADALAWADKLEAAARAAGLTTVARAERALRGAPAIAVLARNG